jgi:hypothetical protein
MRGNGAGPTCCIPIQILTLMGIASVLLSGKYLHRAVLCPMRTGTSQTASTAHALTPLSIMREKSKTVDFVCHPHILSISS